MPSSPLLLPDLHLGHDHHLLHLHPLHSRLDSVETWRHHLASVEQPEGVYPCLVALDRIHRHLGSEEQDSDQDAAVRRSWDWRRRRERSWRARRPSGDEQRLLASRQREYPASDALKRGDADFLFALLQPMSVITASEDDSSPIIMVWDLRNSLAPERVSFASLLTSPS